jgi:hypothetical protein
LDKIGDQLPAIGITAASLTLVFLGFLFASWEGYTGERSSVLIDKYRLRGWLAFSGIVFSLLAVLFGFVGMATAHCHKWVDLVGVVCLAAWAFLIMTQSVVALRGIKQ